LWHDCGYRVAQVSIHAPARRATSSSASSGELSRNGSYSAAARGELPVIRIGRKLFVSIPAIERLIDEGGLRRHEQGGDGR
jgi:hypothetical protein